MTNGFGDKKLKVKINQDELDNLLKKYKGIKKYMKSSLYQIKTMDGTERIVSELVNEIKDNPV
jgi:hypothetical protein